MKICVLGAGVVGTTTAYYLSLAGHEVSVIDRQNGAGLETSFANGGQISVSHSAPWATPDVPFQLIKWFGKEDAPLLYHLNFDPTLWRWSLSFLRNCTAQRLKKNTLHNLKLALYSRDLFHEIRNETDINYDVKKRGILQIYRNIKTMDKSVTHAEWLNKLGCYNKILSQKSCFELEPALQESDTDILGGIHTPDDESGDAFRFTCNLAHKASVNGVKFFYGETIQYLKDLDRRIKYVKTEKGEHYADAFVISLGSFSSLVLKSLGIYLPIYPTKGYSLTIPISGRNNAPDVSVTDSDNKIVYSRLGNRLRVAGTAEFCGYNTELNVNRAKAILTKVKAQFPNGGDFNNATFWTGLRPLTPDGMPVIGKTSFKNLYLNTGHGTLGWTMCTGSGKLISDLISSKTPDIDGSRFGIERF